MAVAYAEDKTIAGKENAKGGYNKTKKIEIKSVIYFNKTMLRSRDASLLGILTDHMVDECVLRYETAVNSFTNHIRTHNTENKNCRR